MALQFYRANVIYTPPAVAFTKFFTVIANSVQTAAITAAQSFEQNNSVASSNGQSFYSGNITSGLVNQTVKNNGWLLVQIYEPNSNTLWLCNVGTVAANVTTVATYNVAVSNSTLVFNGT